MKKLVKFGHVRTETRNGAGPGYNRDGSAALLGFCTTENNVRHACWSDATGTATCTCV